MDHFYAKPRRKKSGWMGFLAQYLTPNTQYGVTVVSAIVLAGFIFSGVLLFRYADSGDLVSRGRTQISQGKVALAAKTLETLLQKNPNHFEGHLLLGDAYLQLDEPEKAKQQFEIAFKLKGNDARDYSASIAMSKLELTKKNYKGAEAILLKSLNHAFKYRIKDKALYTAVYAFYKDWADDLLLAEEEGDKHTYPAIIDRYERALKYVQTLSQQQVVKEKLIETTNFYARYLADKKDFTRAIEWMKKSLQYRYLPETLSEVAIAYEHMEDLDNAIIWYRKAFETNPGPVSMRLTSALMKKGKQLIEAKKTDEAQKYFAEAEQVTKKAKLPLDVIYPIRISEFSLISKPLGDGDFEPKVRVRLENNGDRPLNFLLLKAEFKNSDNLITQVIETAIKPEKPLDAKGQKNSKVTVTLLPEDPINIADFEKGQVRVVVSIAYSEGLDQAWKVKAIQDASLYRRESKPAAPADTGAPVPGAEPSPTPGAAPTSPVPQ